MNYRKKPVVIEARRFTLENGEELAQWCGGRHSFHLKPSDHDDRGQYITIPTLEGNLQAAMNDWIIKGIKGEFYPCKPDIFAATYEAA